MIDSDSKWLYQLRAEGKCCASILVQMGLKLRGEKNDQLVEAVGGLCGGMHNGLACGCLTGAACMLTLFGGRESRPMVKELAEWFESTYGEKYGGVDCSQITNNDPHIRAARCPDIIEATYARAKEILIEQGYDVGSVVDSTEA